MQRISRERIERAARMYSSNKEASRALGIALGSFGRLCRQYGIETPYERKRKANQYAERTAERGVRERPRIFFSRRISLM